MLQGSTVDNNCHKSTGLQAEGLLHVAGYTTHNLKHPHAELYHRQYPGGYGEVISAVYGCDADIYIIMMVIGGCALKKFTLLIYMGSGNLT